MNVMWILTIQLKQLWPSLLGKVNTHTLVTKVTSCAHFGSTYTKVTSFQPSWAVSSCLTKLNSAILRESTCICSGFELINKKYWPQLSKQKLKVWIVSLPGTIEYHLVHCNTKISLLPPSFSLEPWNHLWVCHECLSLTNHFYLMRN